MKEKAEKKKAPYEKGLHKLLLYAISQIYFSMASASFQREFYERRIYGSTEEQDKKGQFFCSLQNIPAGH